MIKKNIILILLLWITSGLSAQEYLSGLPSNPLISANKQQSFTLRSTGQVHLPFLDDFSYRGRVYPTDTLWADRNAFINSTYCINPPTIGVATLDALNDTGAVYTHATPTPFQADYLTSLPIRLDTLFNGSPVPIVLSDSLYFSFYYQPQGVADAPSPGDSLILDFYAPDLHKWFKVWGTGGLTLDSFRTAYNRYFKQVMIPIIQPQYLKDSFQFRFRNFASIAPLSIPSWQSNVDEWNIDYVYLNVNRQKSDTMPQDIAFVDPAPTILKNFTRIPAHHYTNADLVSNMILKESNLSNNLTISWYKYNIKEENGPFICLRDKGVANLFPFITNGYQTYPLHAFPAIDTIFPPFTNDSVVFDITHSLTSTVLIDKNKSNDTIVHRQEFYNSYAYDDGTAENGYGLSGASAKLAYEFTINHPDTLGGVEMYFNETLSYPYFKYFYLMVWSSLNPETVVYKSKRIRPEWADSVINMFHTFQIEDTAVLVGGTFYVGWQQTTDDNLNVGFDRNTNSQNHTYFNVDGNWQSSLLSGSLMMRPMMGASWQKRTTKKWPTTNKFECTIYPNPVNGDMITIGLPSNYNTEGNKKNITIEIFDYLGRSVYNNLFSENLDISFLSKGMYYLRFSNYHTNEVATNKLVVTR